MVRCAVFAYCRKYRLNANFSSKTTGLGCFEAATIGTAMICRALYIIVTHSGYYWNSETYYAKFCVVPHQIVTSFL